MTDGKLDVGAGWWGKNLDDVDTEIVRLASICKVHILDPAVIDRVIHNDASVCESANPAAFGKLRAMVMMHYQIRERTVDALGEAKTQAIIKGIVERLSARYGAQSGRPA